MTAFVAESVFTFIFVLVVLGSTSKGANNRFAGIAIGLTLVMIHIVCIPITGTSVNPARSINPTLYQGSERFHDFGCLSSHRSLEVQSRRLFGKYWIRIKKWKYSKFY